MQLSELARKLGMTLRGADAPFTGLNTLEAASPTEVSFLANPRYAHLLSSTRAQAVIVDEAHAGQVACALVSANPYYDFARAASFFVHTHTTFTGISDQAFIHPTAALGPGCTVHPFAYVGEGAVIGEGTVLFPGVYVGVHARIGAGCTLYPHVVVMAGVTVGNNCTLNPGVVLGTDGFGFTRVAGTIQKVPQIGTVRLDDYVDIGANSCVDRATLNATVIGKNSKIDNLVQIGHNVTVGEQCMLIAQVGIAGSTRVGDRVTMAGQAGIAGHIQIGDDATIGPQSGVPQDLPAGVTGSGSPFMETTKFLRTSLTLPKLPEMYRKIQRLEKEIAELKELVASTAKKEEE